MNRNGIVTQFEFVDRSGGHRIASLGNIHVDMDVIGITNTRDPRWKIYHPEEGLNGTWIDGFDELFYLGTDNRRWCTRVHASKDSTTLNTCNVWLESHIEGESTSNNNDTQFDIYDWNRNVWRVSIANKCLDNHSPSITLEAR